MKVVKTGLTLLATIALIACVSSAARAELLYQADADVIGGGAAQGVLGNYAQYTLGNAFVVGDKDISVTKLGFADVTNGDGLTASHQVGIFTWADTSVLIASVTVPAGSSATNVNDFRYVALDSPITLLAGVPYILAADTAGVAPTAPDSYYYGESNLAVGDGIAYHYGRCQTDQGVGFAAPNHTATITGSVWGIANMQYSVVPEPSTIALLVTGTFGLLAYAWRKRK